MLPRAPGLGRRLASALYDLLLVAALVMIATFPFLAVFGLDSSHGWRRHLLQAWVLAVTGAYFVWFWSRGGQTLPMKTWHLRVVRFDGSRLGAGRAAHRYVLAALGFFAAGLGFLWALVDRDRQFLHDRLAGTAVIDATPRRAP
jgi:uncharacterized RDD family membrane protein YckC